LKEGIIFFPFDSSALEPTYLVELSDGRRLQISNLLYQLLNLCDGKRPLGEIAQVLSGHFCEEISENQIEQFIKAKLLPQGLFQEARDRSTICSRPPSIRRLALQLLQFQLRIPLFSKRRLDSITRFTQYLYARPVVIAMLALVVLVHLLTYWQAPRIVPYFRLQDLSVKIYGPLFVLVLFGSLWHEVGHLSACRRFNCEHGKLGIGLYVIWPVFYVDVSAAWRLPRRQRMVVDLGGFYFQMIMTVVLYIVSLCLSQATLLLPVIIALDMGVIHNLNPMFKFDGYWLLSDMIGVPNLHERIGQYIKGMLPWPRKQNTSSLLRVQPYAIVVTWLYALFGMVFFVYFFWMMIWLGPWIIREYPANVAFLARQTWNALQRWDIIRASGSLIAILFSSIVPFAIGLMLMRLLISLLRLLQAIPRLKSFSKKSRTTST
jgi:putative peptide zinc metalloprotease protein